MIRLIIVLLIFGVMQDSFAEVGKCIPMKTEVPLGVASGSLNYVRISPDGRYVLATVNDEVVLYEVTEKNGKFSVNTYKTPMKAEAYPVQPNWEYISSPFHDGKTKFFKLSDLIALQKSAKSSFEDKFTEYYHSIGGEGKNFRMVLWTYLASRKYKIENGNIIPTSEPSIVCHNLINLSPKDRQTLAWYTKNSGRLMIAIDKLGPVVEAYIKADKNYQASCGENATSPRPGHEADCGRLYQNIYTKVLKVHGAKYGIGADDVTNISNYFDYTISNPDKGNSILINPIISPHGDEIAGLYKGATRVYKINADDSCTETDNLKKRTSKVSFGYKGADGNARYLTFNDVYSDSSESTGDHATFIYDRKTKMTHLMGVQMSSYPNLTRDGRLYYVENGSLIIVDPFQVTLGKVGSACVAAKPKAAAAVPTSKEVAH